MTRYDLKLTNGQTVQARGREGEEAARVDVAAHAEAQVRGWRVARSERYGLFSGLRPIIEPGAPSWKGKR